MNQIYYGISPQFVIILLSHDVIKIKELKKKTYQNNCKFAVVQ